MKNRKSLFIIFAVVALLFIGIGYAALEDTITFKATVTGHGGQGANDEDEELFNVGWVVDSFETVSNTDSTRLVLADFNQGTADADNLTDSISFSLANMCNVGDKVVFKVTLKNAERTPGYSAGIVLTPATSDDPNAPTVKCYFDEALSSEVTANEFTVQNSNTIDIYVVIEQQVTLTTTTTQYREVYTLTFTAEAK